MWGWGLEKVANTHVDVHLKGIGNVMLKETDIICLVEWMTSLKPLEDNMKNNLVGQIQLFNEMLGHIL